MDKHTAGPWKVCIDDSGDEFTGWPLSINAPSVHEDCMVVRTGGQWPYKWDYSVSQAEAVANAHLIAAAPDLLGELKRMVEHFGAFASDHSMEASTETWSALHCARKIIEKAEGRYERC